MGTAVGGVDVIGKGEEYFVVAVVVLHRDLDRDGVLLIFGGKIDDLGMDDLERTLFVDILHKASDTALILIIVFQYFFGIALVAQLDMHAGVEERLFAQTALQHRIVVDRRLLKNQRVRLEAHLGALDVGLADDLELVHDLAAFIALEVDVLAVANLDLQPLGQRVDDRRAHAVQTAGNLVAAAAELAAGVQDGKDDRDRRQTGLAVDADRDASAVVGHANDVALFYHNVNFGAVACQRLVDGVIDDLIHQMVQTARSGRTDVHARALAHRFESFEHLYLVGAVFLFDLGDLYSVFCFFNCFASFKLIHILQN